jgi:hypothetical protein
MIWLSLFMLVGAAFWIIAAYLWYRERRLRTHGLRATGDVVRIDRMQDTEGDALFVRVARFTAVDGRTIEFTDSMPTRDSDRYRTGERVAVLYDRWIFDRARIDPGGTRASGLVVLFVMGLCFVAFACLGFALER